ncbi:MAG: hypothetical protein EOM52_08915 [Clostridia bacterium]|nr:hypothetical protein [Clostridia bacterium]
MLGRICIDHTRRFRVALEEEEILGLRLLKALVPAPGRAGQLRRAARLLAKKKVGRVLVPDGFADWEGLERYGLKRVETEDFCRAIAAPLTLAALRRMDVADESATVVLRGERVTRAMRMAAIALCQRVRNVVISAHIGGEGLQAELRREYGVPNMEEGRGRIPDVALHFSESHGNAAVIFRLYGRDPDLNGLQVGCAYPGIPGDCEQLPLLAALWETGKLRADDPKIIRAEDT